MKIPSVWLWIHPTYLSVVDSLPHHQSHHHFPLQILLAIVLPPIFQHHHHPHLISPLTGTIVRPDFGDRDADQADQSDHDCIDGGEYSLPANPAHVASRSVDDYLNSQYWLWFRYWWWFRCSRLWDWNWKITDQCWYRIRANSNGQFWACSKFNDQICCSLSKGVWRVLHTIVTGMPSLQLLSLLFAFVLFYRSNERILILTSHPITTASYDNTSVELRFLYNRLLCCGVVWSTDFVNHASFCDCQQSSLTFCRVNDQSFEFARHTQSAESQCWHQLFLNALLREHLIFENFLQLFPVATIHAANQPTFSFPGFYSFWNILFGFVTFMIVFFSRSYFSSNKFFCSIHLPFNFISARFKSS